MSGWILHHPRYRAAPNKGVRHAMARYAVLMETLAARGLAHEGALVEAEPLPLEAMTLAHDASYVSAVAEERLAPEAARRIGFAPTKANVERLLATSGGTLDAARIALEDGIACNMAGGSHHAHRAYGSGYCVFNDIAIALRRLLDDRAIARALVIDLDVHQGDGTASIFEGDPRVVTFSMHGRANFPIRKARSDVDVELDDGVGDDLYLGALEAALGPLIDRARPDLLLYVAGVDPHRVDKLGRLKLSDDGLRARERLVLNAAHARGAPLASVKAGGYGDSAEEVAARTAILFEEAASIYGKERRWPPSPSMA